MTPPACLGVLQFCTHSLSELAFKSAAASPNLMRGKLSVTLSTVRPLMSCLWPSAFSKLTIHSSLALHSIPPTPPIVKGPLVVFSQINSTQGIPSRNTASVQPLSKKQFTPFFLPLQWKNRNIGLPAGTGVT